MLLRICKIILGVTKQVLLSVDWASEEHLECCPNAVSTAVEIYNSSSGWPEQQQGYLPTAFFFYSCSTATTEDSAGFRHVCCKIRSSSVITCVYRISMLNHEYYFCSAEEFYTSHSWYFLLWTSNLPQKLPVELVSCALLLWLNPMHTISPPTNEHRNKWECTHSQLCSIKPAWFSIRKSTPTVICSVTPELLYTRVPFISLKSPLSLSRSTRLFWEHQTFMWTARNNWARPMLETQVSPR